jgi:hypothetical protein
MTVRVIVAAHKKAPMPADPLYLPLHVGAAGKESIGFRRDDEGENISLKNSRFSELTGLYWAWKNLDADALGLCHYRRYFAGRPFGSRWERILTGEQAEKLLSRTPVVLPRKRNYYIETGWSQYAHAHHEEDLLAVRAILETQYPAYVPAFDRTLGRTKGHRFNMFIMSREALDTYCTWLFAVLAELEGKLDISEYSRNDQRVFGFVAERLLDVWIETEGVPYCECPVIHMESQHWLKKGSAFLKRKFSAK